MTTVSQRSFSRGEIAPSEYARADLLQYQTGARTVRNYYVMRYGGLENRPGTQFLSETSDSTKSARLIGFDFSSDRRYVLEFGQLYMRVYKDGVLQTEATQVITGATQADPCVVTIASHGYSNGDEVAIEDVIGMTQLNGRTFKIANVAANTFELQEMDGTTDIDSTGYTAYGSAGTAGKVFELVTPYTAPQVSALELKHHRLDNVLTLVHSDHAPQELTNTSDIVWSLDLITFQPNQDAPTDVASTVGVAGSDGARYMVTAVNEDGEESLPGISDLTPVVISGATQASPCVVTATSHGYGNNSEVEISGIVGMTELNGRIFTVDNVTANTYELIDVDSTNYTAYGSAGTSVTVFAEITSAADPTVANPNVISWVRAAEAVEYNVYKETDGVYGQIGIASGTTFDDINITPNTSFTPPASRNPFVGTGNYPSVVTNIQQRRAFAATDNKPTRSDLSKTGDTDNFTRSRPSQDDDALSIKSGDTVKALLDLGVLVMLTESGKESVPGGQDGVLTPSTAGPKSYPSNGCGDLQPIIVDDVAIYMQSRNNTIRSLNYSFETDNYKGDELSLNSAHLLDNYTITDWAYQAIPHSIVWMVRSDGELVGMTYIPNQQVIGFHHHDLAGGLAESVAVVPEGSEDVVYVLVRRVINSKVVRFVERFSSRQIVDVIDNKWMDSHLSYDGRHTGVTTMTLTTGAGWTHDDTLTCTASVAAFTSAAIDVGNAVHVTDSTGVTIRCEITGFTSTTVVSVQPHKDVPASLQGVAADSWGMAVDEIAGLWHLEGEDLSILGDALVVGSPNNPAYTTYTVASGSVTLDRPYLVIHAGLPYISDGETLDIESTQGETLIDKKILITELSMFVKETRGVWAGTKPPSDDTTDPLEDLVELKIRDTETYEEAVALATKPVDLSIKSEWNRNGRVFVRQIDPLPITILSINPSGKIPFK